VYLFSYFLGLYPSNRPMSVSGSADGHPLSLFSRGRSKSGGNVANLLVRRPTRGWENLFVFCGEWTPHPYSSKFWML